MGAASFECFDTLKLRLNGIVCRLICGGRRVHCFFGIGPYPRQSLLRHCDTDAQFVSNPLGFSQLYSFQPQSLLRPCYTDGQFVSSPLVFS